MAKILITGSSDGIGQAGAKLLAEQGHKVYLHARNSDRAKQAHDAVPKAEGVVIGDLTTIDGAKKTAAEANKVGPFDTVIRMSTSSSSNLTARCIDKSSRQRRPRTWQCRPQNRRWPAVDIRSQLTGSLHPDLPHGQAEATTLSIITATFRWRR